MQSNGLVTEFRDNEEFRRLVLRSAILPLVPVNCVEDVWLNALEDSEDDSARCVKFKDYVTEQWVEGDKAMWNHFDNAGPRTTNHVEGWHHKINTLLKHSHPNIYVILELFRKEQATNEVKIIQHANGGKQRPRKRVYRRLDHNLGMLKHRLTIGEINVIEYADAASFFVKLGQ